MTTLIDQDAQRPFRDHMAASGAVYQRSDHPNATADESWAKDTRRTPASEFEAFKLFGPSCDDVELPGYQHRTAVPRSDWSIAW
jgi:hypothetical protein